MHFANCEALVIILFITLIQNLRLCSFAEAGIVLNLFLNFEQNEPRVLVKYCSYKKKKCIETQRSNNHIYYNKYENI